MSEPTLGLTALVAHARRVPSETRERFAIEAEPLGRDRAAMIVRTCHRVEVYVATEALRGDAVPALPTGAERLDGRAAARHLFAVAAGLDSIVVGEDQILHQLRASVTERHHGPTELTGPLPEGRCPMLDPLIERLFQVALNVGRRAHAWREGPPRSLSDVALDQIEAAAGPLARQTLLVVGAGTMGRLAALSASRRHARVLVSNRTDARARALANDVDGEVLPFGADVPLSDIFGVIVALGGRWELGPIASRSLIAGPVPVVDLSSPPSLEPALRESLGSRYVSVDDLARSPQAEVSARFRRRVERLIDEADADLGRWVAARSAVPAIQALTKRAEIRRADEVERLLRRMPELDEHDRDLVDQMSRRLVAALLHAPLATLREDETGDQERAARELFAL